MTTPSEEEARALIRELNDHAIRLRDYEDGEWDQELIDGWEEAAELLDRASAALASRVSTPPSEDWEYGTGHRWVDQSGNEQWFVQNGTIAPGYVQDYIAEGGKVIRRRVGPWEPVPAVPVLPTEGETK